MHRPSCLSICVVASTSWVEGLSLIRSAIRGDRAAVTDRIREIGELIDDIESGTFRAGLDVTEVESAAGYASWAESYEQPNWFFGFERAAVEPVLDDLPGGRTLDAGCGTGRYSVHLRERGHRVAGVDLSAAMLAVAARRVPVVVGDLLRLPFADATFDNVVCILTLTHLASLDEPVGELGRVVATGGTVVLSESHPTALMLGWGQAIFRDACGRRRFVRNHVHLPSAYVDAFTSSGLLVRRCIEVPLERRGGAAGAGLRGTPELEAFVEAFEGAYVGVPALLWVLERSAER